MQFEVRRSKASPPYTVTEPAAPTLVVPVFPLYVFARHSRSLQPTAHIDRLSPRYCLKTVSPSPRISCIALASHRSTFLHVLARSGSRPPLLKNYFRTRLLGPSDPATYSVLKPGIVHAIQQLLMAFRPILPIQAYIAC